MPADSPDSPSLITASRLLLMLATVLVFGLVYWLADDYLSPGEGEIAALDPGCDLRSESCHSVFANGTQVEFAISPKDFSLSQPMQLQVTVSGSHASKVEVDFAGVTMDMGFNRPLLNALSTTQFEGSTILPVCTLDSMEWEARVLIYAEQGLLIAPYRFTTHK